jgi:hypothetical protein
MRWREARELDSIGDASCVDGYIVDASESDRIAAPPRNGAMGISGLMHCNKIEEVQREKSAKNCLQPIMVSSARPSRK